MRGWERYGGRRDRRGGEQRPHGAVGGRQRGGLGVAAVVHRGGGVGAGAGAAGHAAAEACEEGAERGLAGRGGHGHRRRSQASRKGTISGGGSLVFCASYCVVGTLFLLMTNVLFSILLDFLAFIVWYTVSCFLFCRWSFSPFSYRWNLTSSCFLTLSLRIEQDISIWSTLAMAFQTLGVVYGDMGTSPLYVFSDVFSKVPIKSEVDVLGALSLVMYTIALIPFAKYIFIVLKANDNGEGIERLWKSSMPFYNFTCSCLIYRIQFIYLRKIISDLHIYLLFEMLVLYHVSIRKTLCSDCSTITASVPAGGTFALYSLICRYAKVSLLPNQQRADEDISSFRLKLPTPELERALYIKEVLEKNSFSKRLLLLLVLMGTSMIIGDGILTPSMSGTQVFQFIFLTCSCSLISNQ